MTIKRLKIKFVKYFIDQFEYIEIKNIINEIIFIKYNYWSLITKLYINKKINNVSNK